MATQVPPAGTRGGKLPHGPVLRAGMRVMRVVHHLTGNKMKGQPLLYLTTVGARSGKRRTVPVAAFAEGEGAWLVVGSAGGAAQHPAWFFNLMRNPGQVEIEWQGRTLAVTPRMLEGEERAAAWTRIVQERPNFGEYEQKTDREIPVVRLTAR